MSPTQSDDEKGSEVCVRGEEEDPLTQMLNDLSLKDAADAKTAAHKESADDLAEGLKDLDIKKEEHDALNEESEPEEETEEQINLEKVDQHEDDKLNLDGEEKKEESNHPKEIDESLSEESIKNKDIQSDDDKTAEESDDENPPDDAYTNDKSFEPEKNYDPQSTYKPDLETSPEEPSIIKPKDNETPKKPKPKTRYASRGLGSGAGTGMEYHNAFPDQFMYQDQFRAAAPFSTMQPNSSPAYAWSPDNSQNSSPTHAWSPDNAQNSSPTYAWTPDNSFSMDAFDSSAFNSPPYMSGSECGNQGSAGQMYMNQTTNYLDQYNPLTPPFSDGASIQDESDFSDGVPSPMAPSQQEFANEYAMTHDEHSLDDILEVLNQEKFGGLDVTGCVPPEKIMPYLQELLRIPEVSENTDTTNQDVSQIQPRLQARQDWPDGRSQTSAEHEIRKRINPEVLEKTTRQINYQENEKLCEKDEEGDTPYMVVVSNYERKNYYELLYAMQERLKTIRMCCDLPVCVRTHACKACGNADDLQCYSPLSMRNNVGDTALKNAVLMKFPKEVVNYLCCGLEERQGDMRRVFDMETSNFFQQNSFIYPVLARFL